MQSNFYSGSITFLDKKNSNPKQISFHTYSKNISIADILLTTKTDCRVSLILFSLFTLRKKFQRISCDNFLNPIKFSPYVRVSASILFHTMT